MGEPTSVDLVNLQREVTRLAVSAAQNAAAQREFAGSVAAAVRSVRRQRRGLVAVAAALVGLLIAVTLVIVVNVHQSCTNHRSALFFAAERDKVSGQVAGLDEMQTAGTDRAKALDGFERFKHASEHYLSTIATLPKC